jgi:triosephosphate isomerase
VKRMVQSIEKYIEDIVRKTLSEKVTEFQATGNNRRKLVVANWKMNMTLSTAIQFISDMSKVPTDSDQEKVVICPPFPLLYPLKCLIQKSDKAIALGAQNVHWEEKGAHTGEVSANMLTDIGCQFVIIGHSERRIAGETDEMVSHKVLQSLASGLEPIICVGETQSEREQNQTFQVIKDQVLGALHGVEDLSQIVIAYEPVWAIGTGDSATPEQAQQVHEFIRSTLKEAYGEIAEAVPILYGGSVNATNAKDLSEMKDIDGALVGGASLVAENFEGIVQSFV